MTDIRRIVEHAVLTPDSHLWISAPPGLGVSQAVVECLTQNMATATGFVVVTAPYRLLLDQWEQRLVDCGVQATMMTSTSDALVILSETERAALKVLLVTHTALPRVINLLDALHSRISTFVVEDPPASATALKFGTPDPGVIEHSINEALNRADRSVVLSREPFATPHERTNSHLVWNIKDLQNFTGNTPTAVVHSVPDDQLNLEARANRLLRNLGQTTDPGDSLLGLQSRLLRVPPDSPHRELALRLSDEIDDAPTEQRLPILTDLVNMAAKASRPVIIRALRINDMEYLAEHLRVEGHRTLVISSSSDVRAQGDIFALLADGVVLIGGRALETRLSPLPPRTTLIYWSVPRMYRGFWDAIALGSRSKDVELNFLATGGWTDPIQHALSAAFSGVPDSFTSTEWGRLLGPEAK